MIKFHCGVSLCFTFTGLAAPLVVTEKGEKLGKTSGNAIWLDKDKTTHGEMKSYLSGLSKLDLASLALKITPQPSEQICVSGVTLLVKNASQVSQPNTLTRI